MTTKQYKTLLDPDDRTMLIDCYGKYIEFRDQAKDWLEGERREKIKLYNKLKKTI